MGSKQAAAALLLLAGSSLSGCVAVAIPALAGSAMVGSRVIEGGSDAPEAAASPAPAPSPSAAPAPAPQADPVSIPAAPKPPIAPVPTPSPAATPVATAPTTPPPAPEPTAAPPPPPPPSNVIRPATPPPPPAAAPPAGVPAAAMPPLAAYPDPDRPIPANQANFARFVRYAQATARSADSGTGLPSAVLSDPVALDGKRRRCAVGEQLVAVIDLDPPGNIFAPPAAPASQPGIALGLAVLRQAGVEIAWLSDLSTEQSGALRTALERSGLDPRGQDIISLRRDGGGSKQERRENLAGIACVVAIAGDERPDFDERFKYLRNPEAGAGLEPLIGDGWFLIQPLLGN